MHRIPSKKERPIERKKWLAALNLSEDDVLDHYRICHHHFQNGDITQVPSLFLGERFMSPKKSSLQRNKTSLKRKQSSFLYEPAMKQLNISTIDTQEGILTGETPIGETLLTDYSVHELPSETPDSFDDPCCSNSTVVPKPTDESALIYAALTARIEYLEAQNKSLVKQLRKHFDCRI